MSRWRGSGYIRTPHVLRWPPPPYIKPGQQAPQRANNKSTSQSLANTHLGGTGNAPMTEIERNQLEAWLSSTVFKGMRTMFRNMGIGRSGRGHNWWHISIMTFLYLILWPLSSRYFIPAPAPIRSIKQHQEAPKTLTVQRSQGFLSSMPHHPAPLNCRHFAGRFAGISKTPK